MASHPHLEPSATRDPAIPTPREALTRPAEVSLRAAAVARSILRPIERFLQVEAASGVVLLATAAIALLLASSRYAAAYHGALETPLGLVVGRATVSRPLHFFIDDVLMTVFFFVVGLEIRREMQGGELSSARRAALPLAAALGGMVAPALLYAVVNRGDAGALHGWGVPMATDIAFAVGVLALLGKRVPPALRVLLLALAVIDDVGSIAVIAVFYSSGFRADGLLVAAAGVALTVLMQRAGARRALLYVLPGAMVWLGVLRTGVHPTLAGVVMGLLTPARAWYGAAGLVTAVRTAAHRVARGLVAGEADAAELARERHRIEEAQREALSPAARLQAALHPWVAFGIMPLFALANAGVTIDAGASRALSRVSLGVVLGLVVGKPTGILLAIAIAVRSRVASLPRGIGARELLVLGAVAGVGFTMALFVGALAFEDASRLDEAKLAVLAASALAGLVALVLGRTLLPARFAPDAARSADDAEHESAPADEA